MADAKIVDIKGVQWELKDGVARNDILELKNKNEEITASINNIENTHFPGTIEFIRNFTNTDKWFKLSNFYNGQPYNNNVFILTARQGEMIELICSVEDNYTSVIPIAIRYIYALGRIKSIKFKDGDIYILSGPYNSIRINQISGLKCEGVVTEEEPPSDATDVKVLQVSFG